MYEVLLELGDLLETLTYWLCPECGRQLKKTKKEDET